MKAQSAIEYLMTYGWMLLVVAIVGGTVFSVVGDQNIHSVTGFNSNNLDVSDIGATSKTLSVVLQPKTGKITLTRLKAKQDGAKINIPVNSEISATTTKVISLPYFRQSTSSKQTDIELIYNTDQLQNISSSGTINADLKLDERLKGYWTLNPDQANNTHVFDISPGSNIGKINGARFTHTAERGHAMSFDGVDDRIKMDNVSKDEYNYLGVSFWFFNEDRNHKDLENLFIAEETTFWCGIRGDITDNPIQCRRGWGGGVTEDVDYGWNHIYAGFSEETQKVEIWVNGEHKSSGGSQEGTENVVDSSIVIGNRENSDNGFEGVIDSIQIYNRELTNSEIESLYRKSLLLR